MRKRACLKGVMDQKKKALLVSQELFFAKTLAGNDKTKRDRALKKLHRWLYSKTRDTVSGFTEEDFMRIWKGLFYCMWMSDKPLVQEEVAENISNLIHSVGEGDSCFIKCFFVIMVNEWNGIDQHRLDKFQMLFRRFLRQSLEWGRKKEWSNSLPTLVSLWEETVLKPVGSTHGVPIGLLLHFCDIFLEELAKIVDENGLPPSSDTVIQFLRPFARLLAKNDDPRISKSVTETVFNYLMRQSDVGLDYEELKKKGLHLKERELMEEDEGIGDEDGAAEEEEDEEEIEEDEQEVLLGAKDPRAGGVDVVLPQLDVDLDDLAIMLEEEVKDPSVRPKLRRRVEDLAKRFRSLTKGYYPLGVGPLPDLDWKRSQRSKAIKNAALDLLNEEEEFLKSELGHYGPVEEEEPKKICNGKIPKEGQKNGRKRKRGKRKPYSERRRAAKAKVEENGVDEVKPRRVSPRMCTKKQELEPPLKKRRSICEGWQVGELKLTPKRKSAGSGIVGGEWSVENSASKGKVKEVKKSTKSPKQKQTVEDVQNGETEIVIRKLRPNPFSPFTKKITPKTTRKEEILKGSASKLKTPSSDKRVKIVLSRNLAQETHEYQKSLRDSPAIPFDPSKVPTQGVLKATSSPIMLNPFYRTSPRRQKIIFP
ncbi:hypothetical protein J437_LFUL008871 [Ladona fulva]|uniref:Ribosomal RNA processing protein 1 homolog n=1 Tax=Ladona fulva TaxID=123851 RepID=A0A8K0P364_LADFU|nr:hypothetical protein J437_LFUL008871 [Ladona fulva]